MRAVIQRVTQSRVQVDQQTVGEIQKGLLVLLGVTHEDTESDARYLADKIAHLRIFEDEAGKMNLSLLDIGGEILSVSQLHYTATAALADGLVLLMLPSLSRLRRCMKYSISLWPNGASKPQPGSFRRICRWSSLMMGQ